MKIRVALAFAFALAVAGCSSDEGPAPLPVPEAERARDLTFLSTPAARTISSDAYQAEEDAEGQDLSDDYVAYMRDSYGRLGFFPATHDLRSVRGAQASIFAAYYSSETKLITLIGVPEQRVVVHELVHALQDQYFDLKGLYEEQVSSDETIALRGLIEGDAVMAEYRHEVWRHGGLPARTLAPQITPHEARAASERALDTVPGPAFFKAYPAFAYSYGAAFVANRLAIAAGSWSTRTIDAIFRAGGPSTTREVLIGGGVKDVAAAAVGLSRLPPELVGSHDVEIVDRLGAWYTYLLIRPVLARDALLNLVPAWRGDQLLMLRERDVSIPRGKSKGRGVMWTSLWESAAHAGEIAGYLQRVHGAVHEPEAGANIYRASDGERIWLGNVEGTLVFVKGFAPEVMQILSRAVFETHDEKRLRIFRSYANDPRVHCLR